MQKFLFYSKRISLIFQFMLLGTAAVQFYTDFHKSLILLVFLLILDGFLILGDIYRIKSNLTQEYNILFISASILICTVMMLVRREDTIQVYYFFILDHIFHIQNKSIRNRLLIAHFSSFLVSGIIEEFFMVNKGIIHSMKSITFIIVCYGLLMFVFIVIHYFKSEQKRLKIINADLITYSFEEREYLVAKERGEISQELHDSIGHSLMAALMNVRYLKAILNKSNEDKEKQIDEIEDMLKKCVASLRSSVSNLRKIEENIDLKEEIIRIQKKFNELGITKIELDYDDKVSDGPELIKLAIYKTIREGITNSVQHGNASKISISINYVHDRIELVIQDNGSGSAVIHNSFGLNGIVERIKTIGGEVSFISEKNKGFTIHAMLPGRVEP